MYCPKCGTENRDDARYCIKCGCGLEEYKTPTPAKGPDTFPGKTGHPSSHQDSFAQGTKFVPSQQDTFGKTRMPPGLESFPDSGLVQADASRFKERTQIGKGGMGVVYKAYDSVMEEWVVLKTLPSELRKEPRLLERFFREARLGRKLSHPNIVRVYDLLEIQDSWYFCAEYVQGKDLKDLINENKTGLAFEAVARIFRQVSDALGYAHKQGVIHRDIKSANILLNEKGDAKLSDFGIARASEFTGITRSGERLGTPAYMSPEQFEGKEADARSDIYSLGVVLFETLTGRIPFEGDFSRVMRGHLRDEPPRVKDFRSEVPGYWQAILDRCLAKRREDRYQNLDLLLSDLRGYLEGGGVSWSGFKRVKGEFKPFEFKEASEKAYDEKELSELIRRYPDEAGKYMQTGEFEKWLDYLGADETRDRVKVLRASGGDMRAAALELVEGKRPFILRKGQLVWSLKELLDALKADAHEGRYQLYLNLDNIHFWLSYIGEKNQAGRARRVTELCSDRTKGLEAFLDETNEKLAKLEIELGIAQSKKLAEAVEYQKALDLIKSFSRFGIMSDQLKQAELYVNKAYTSHKCAEARDLAVKSEFNRAFEVLNKLKENKIFLDEIAKAEENVKIRLVTDGLSKARLELKNEEYDKALELAERLKKYNVILWEISQCETEIKKAQTNSRLEDARLLAAHKDYKGAGEIVAQIKNHGFFEDEIAQFQNEMERTIRASRIKRNVIFYLFVAAASLGILLYSVHRIRVYLNWRDQVKNTYSQLQANLASYKIDDAYDDYKSLISLNPDHPDRKSIGKKIAAVYLKRANDFYSDKNLTDAYKFYALTAELDPDSQDAKNAMAKIVDKYLSNANAYFSRGWFVSPSGKNAYETYQLVLQLDPTNKKAQEGIAKVEEEKARIINEYIARANQYSSEGKNILPVGENAYEMCKTVLALAPGHEECQRFNSEIITRYLADADKKISNNSRLSISDAKECYEIYRRVLYLEPNNETARNSINNLKDILVKLGDRAWDEEAIEYYNLALEIEPNNEEVGDKIEKKLQHMQKLKEQADCYEDCNKNKKDCEENLSLTKTIKDNFKSGMHYKSWNRTRCDDNWDSCVKWCR